MSPGAKGALGAIVGMLLIWGAVAVYVVLYLINVPGSVAATANQLYLATVATAEATDAHPTWVSYYAVNSSSGDWRHDTTLKVPAHTIIHMTIYQYDTATGLRNPFFAQPTGTVGPATIDGKPTSVVDPTSPGHTFAIPQIGLSVPLPGAPMNAKNLCAQAPCSLSQAHVTVSFSFRTPGPGLYRWQCFVPCGAGFIQGNGGPMQTEGYMGGYLKVA